MSAITAGAPGPPGGRRATKKKSKKTIVQRLFDASNEYYKSVIDLRILKEESAAEQRLERLQKIESALQEAQALGVQGVLLDVKARSSGGG